MKRGMHKSEAIIVQLFYLKCIFLFVFPIAFFSASIFSNKSNNKCTYRSENIFEWKSYNEVDLLLEKNSEIFFNVSSANILLQNSENEAARQRYRIFYATCEECVIFFIKRNVYLQKCLLNNMRRNAVHTFRLLNEAVQYTFIRTMQDSI